MLALSTNSDFVVQLAWWAGKAAASRRGVVADLRVPSACSATLCGSPPEKRDRQMAAHFDRDDSAFLG